MVTNSLSRKEELQLNDVLRSAVTDEYHTVTRRDSTRSEAGQA